MKILVIAGFLGCGKTSFIKAMSKACKREFVVVENEFGELGLDGPLLSNNHKALSKEEALKEMKVWELTEGCVCCSMNIDFTQSVLTIANVLNPDYLLVEPSGVAKPSRIIENLRKIQYDQIQLLEPVSIIDAENYAYFRRDFPPYFEDQIQGAGSVILSKSENLSPSQFEAIAKELGLPENTNFPTQHYSQWSKDDWFRILRRLDGTSKAISEGRADAEHHNDPMADMESMGFRQLSLLNPDVLVGKLNTLLLGSYGDIYRAKGYFPCGQEYLHFDLVNRSYQLNACPPMGDSRLVIIGKQLNRQALKELFEAVQLEKDETSAETERLFPELLMGE